MAKRARGKCSGRGKAGEGTEEVWKFCRQEGDAVKYQQLESLICHSVVQVVNPGHIKLLLCVTTTITTQGVFKYI